MAAWEEGVSGGFYSPVWWGGSLFRVSVADERPILGLI